MVIEKPAGISSVPYERKETGTAHGSHPRCLAPRRHAARPPARFTSSTASTRTPPACSASPRPASPSAACTTIFQRHDGAPRVPGRRAGRASRAGASNRSLVADRGDGIRGLGHRRADRTTRPSTRSPTSPRLSRLRGATLCRVRLETGRTHQIRIHLSEAGHPIVGETVYVPRSPAPGRRALPGGAPHAARRDAGAGPSRDGRAPRLRGPASARLRRDPARAGALMPSPLPRRQEHPLGAGGDLRGRCAPATGPAARSPADLPDGGHDPTFLERGGAGAGVPLRRGTSACALLGIENIPDAGAGAAGRQSLGRHPLRWGAADLQHLPRPSGPPPAAHAGGQLRLPLALDVATSSARIGGVRASKETALPLLAAASCWASSPRA